MLSKTISVWCSVDRCSGNKSPIPRARQELRAVFVERKQKGIHLDDAEIDDAIERIFAKHDADANAALSFKEFAAAWNDLLDEIVKLNKLAIGKIVEQSNFRCE